MENIDLSIISDCSYNDEVSEINMRFYNNLLDYDELQENIKSLYMEIYDAELEQSYINNSEEELSAPERPCFNQEDELESPYCLSRLVAQCNPDTDKDIDARYDILCVENKRTSNTDLAEITYGSNGYDDVDLCSYSNDEQDTIIRVSDKFGMCYSDVICYSMRCSYCCDKSFCEWGNNCNGMNYRPQFEDLCVETKQTSNTDLEEIPYGSNGYDDVDLCSYSNDEQDTIIRVSDKFGMCYSDVICYSMRCSYCCDKVFCEWGNNCDGLNYRPPIEQYADNVLEYANLSQYNDTDLSQYTTYEQNTITRVSNMYGMNYSDVIYYSMNCAYCGENNLCEWGNNCTCIQTKICNQNWHQEHNYINYMKTIEEEKLNPCGWRNPDTGQW